MYKRSASAKPDLRSGKAAPLQLMFNAKDSHQIKKIQDVLAAENGESSFVNGQNSEALTEASSKFHMQRQGANSAVNLHMFRGATVNVGRVKPENLVVEPPDKIVPPMDDKTEKLPEETKKADPVDQVPDVPEDSILPSEVPVTMGDISVTPKNAIEPSEEDKSEVPVKKGPAERSPRPDYEHM